MVVISSSPSLATVVSAGFVLVVVVGVGGVGVAVTSSPANIVSSYSKSSNMK